MTTIKLSTLNPNARNPRKINSDAMKKLCESIERDPQFMELRPIVIDEDRTILGGNQRFRACQQLGMKEVPASWVKTAIGLTDEQRRRFILVDNAPEGMAGEWDLEILTTEWQMPELGDLGFDLNSIMADLNVDLPTNEDVDAEPQIDRAEELRKEWNVETGQLWQLGEHRLLCGDSTKAEDVDRSMAGETCEICFTSPPYNAGDNSLGGNKSMVGSKYRDSTDNLTSDDYLAFLRGFTDEALRTCRFVIVNLQQLAGNKVAIIEWAYHYRDHFADRAVWFKGLGRPAMAKNVMNSRFEDLWFLGQNKKANRAISTGNFHGTVPNVYQGAGASGENVAVESHAATMPVHLARWVVSTFSTSSVYEPFSGSGTTIIACEQLGRKCRAIEISPGYVAVALQRFKDATGKTPTRRCPKHKLKVKR